MSALAACHVLFYTKHTWKENIGEALENENLFNSVYWDAKTGTFVQRKAVYCQIKTRSKISVLESSKSSDITITGTEDLISDTAEIPEDLISDTAAKTDKKLISAASNVSTHSSIANGEGLETKENVKNLIKTKSETISPGAKVESCIDSHDSASGLDSNKKDQEVHVPCATQKKPLKDSGEEGKSDGINQSEKNVYCLDASNDIGEEHIPSNQGEIMSNSNSDGVTGNPSTEIKLKQTQSSMEKNIEKEHIREPEQSFGIKQSVVQRSQVVDKNKFIHVFLKRAASARSNQNSLISFENMDSSFDGSYLEIEEDVPDHQDVISTSLTENDEHREENRHPVVAIVYPTYKESDVRESVHYSLQNAISSSLQTSNTVDDADSLNSVEQNKQKLLTQQRQV